jgi:hypothetical protein
LLREGKLGLCIGEFRAACTINKGLLPITFNLIWHAAGGDLNAVKAIASDQSRARLALAHFLIYFGLALAMFALVQHFTWNGSFYWLRQASTHVTSPFGPFVNRNHFAGYMEMLIPLPLAIVITRAGSKDLRIFHLFAAAMMAIAAVASLSRGGMISLVAELIFLVQIHERFCLRSS